MLNLSIGETIRKYRVMKNLTQAELAAKLSKVEGKNIAASAIAGYESGQRIPKVEVRVQIAKILGVDPIALSGIELDKDDEIRLLCKLLYKYAKDITLEEDGEVTVQLPIDFAAFQMEYEENKDRLEFLYLGEEEGSLSCEIYKQTVDDEMEYWLEHYPISDAVRYCTDRKPNFTVEDIRDKREMIKTEMFGEFTYFQDNYLVPLLNKHILEKIKKK